MRPDQPLTPRNKLPSDAKLPPEFARRPESSRLLARLSDEARFLRTWLDRPLATGAISPSGPALARAMAAPVDPSLPGPVIELGPGTGPVTEALLARGVPEHRLILVEFDPDFCALLAERFPAATVVEGDAYALERTLGGWLPERAAACVSSLPLLTRPEGEREALLRDAFRLLQPEAPFVQFTYGLGSPVPHDGGGVAATVSPPIWLNLPPARVWVYRADPTVLRRHRAELFDRLIDRADHAWTGCATR